ncbi:MAG: MFS transporter [Dethiobacter sp.]|nr:MAG: MFS transporter [Dethiobacter sp.]
MIRISKRDVVFVVFCVLFIFALFLRTSTAIIVEDLMRDFAIPAASLGLMASAFFYAYAVVQIPVGLLSDRIGVRYTVFGFGLLGVAGSILFAFSTGIQMATWARLLTGIGTAGIWIPALKYLSVSYRPDEFATLTSIINAIGGLGLMLATLPMALLVERIGWRHSFILPTPAMFLLVLLAWYLMKPQTHPVTGQEEISKEQRKEVAATSLPGTVPFWRHRSFWPFALWALLVYGVLFSFSGLWGAAYLQDSYNISRETAGSHLMFISLGMIIGGLFWGMLSDRFFRARRPVLFLGTLGMLLTWAAMLSLSAYPGPFYISLIYFALGIFSIVFLINLGCVKELFPVKIAGTAMGTVNASMFVGVALFQGISGYLLDHFLETQTALSAYRSIFTFYLVSMALALFLVVLMPETFPRETKKPARP